jgi:hypothetical protein
VKRTLHLVRRAAEPIAAPDDWIVDLDHRVLVARATPPIVPGPITDAQLVELIFAADRVVTW